MENGKNPWKTVGMVFISLFVLQTLIFGWLMMEGTKIIKMEEECSINVCSEAETFYFDEYTRECYCFVGDELITQQQM